MRASTHNFRSRSLAEIHNSVGTSHASPWRRLLAFAGPAYLVSVGYMDPGNWATDLEGGAKFGYRLLWVLVMSNAMAILLQTLSARFGVITGKDLAQACRDAYPRPVSNALWFLCEIAIAACDLAEILGAAIGLNLLFQLPLLIGVLVTAFDTLVLLSLQQFRIRSLEAMVIRLIVIISACLGSEIFFAKPETLGILSGLVPRLDRESLFATIAILGATVMPHNLYLHSALVQSRKLGTSIEAKRRACRYNLVDTLIALNGAMFVNIAILVLAGAVFFRRSIEVVEIQQATRLLEPLMGNKAAGVIFAIALLCAGQASTLTGTMAGQIVMEGFLNIRIRAWMRRLLTRLIAIIPAAITVSITGDKGAYQLLLLTQAVLSLQLPFAVIPLIRFTGDRRRMGVLANGIWLRSFAWLVAGINLLLNLWLARLKLVEWLSMEGVYVTPVRIIVVLAASGLILLLLYIWVAPLRNYGGSESPDAEEESQEPPLFVDSVNGGQEVIERLGAFMTHLNGVVFIKDPAGRYVFASSGSTDLWGMDPECVLSKRDDELWPAELAYAYQRDDDQIYKHLKRVEGIESIQNHGEPHSWLLYKFPIVERATQLVFLGGVGVDITGRQRTEASLRGLAARLQSVRESERALTSREVHDLGQILTALDLHLSTIAMRMSGGADAASLAESLTAASAILASTIASSSKISGRLRPSILDNLGLADAIVWQAQDFAERAGILISIERLDKVLVDPQVGVVVFRLLQNILSNIERHAHATELRIGLLTEDTHLVLRVSDNGRGITQEQIVSPRSFGLIEMRELSLSFGGEIRISGMETGTTVSVHIPQNAQIVS